MCIVDQRPPSHVPFDFDYVRVDPPDVFTHLAELVAAQRVGAQEFYSVAEGVFGPSLVEWVRESGLIDRRAVQLDRRQCLEMLACIGHSATRNDLNALQEKVSALQADHPLKQFLGGDFHKLVSLLRNPLALLEANNPRTLWEEIVSYPKGSDKKYMAYTRYQETMQALMKNADQERPEFAFAPHEHLAKFVG